MHEKLKKKLLYLRERHGVVAVKGGTEIEDMSFEELGLLCDISSSIVPLIVKIGGAEARNDIRFCLKKGIYGILAPMIESDYALGNFVSTVKQISTDEIFKKLFLAINLETITGYYNINPIIANPLFKHINQITIGRTDLAASMEKGIDSEEVSNITSDIVSRMTKENKITSVGGKVDPINSAKIKAFVKPTKINTRHIAIDLTRSRNLSLSICEALSFEIELYKLLMTNTKDKKDAYEKRIAETKLKIERRDFSLSKV